jgi:hypothetical protein
MKKLILLLPLILCACKSEEEKRSEWIAQCAQADFTVKQCGVLYSIAKSSSDASDAAAASSMMSGAAMGMSAGGRR